MKLIFMLISYGIYMIGLRIKGSIYKILKKFSTKEKAEAYRDRVVFNWANFTIKIIGLKVNVVGKENIPKEACVFISNHQSILDIPVLFYGAHRVMGFIAKKELLKVPVIGYWLKVAHCVPIDRENVREAIKVIQIGSENLLKGDSMGIFPEGTRAKDGIMKPLKKGSLKLATKAKAPIVPVTINGTYKAYELNKKIQSAEVTIIFDKPIYTDNISREEERELHTKVQDVIMKNLEKLQKE